MKLPLKRRNDMWAKIWTWIKNWFGKKADKVVVDPAIKEPAATCGCDLTKPLVVPLVPRHGVSEADVDLWLRDGGASECGGMPEDIRFVLLRPSGNSWCYAPFAKSGLVEYSNGKIKAKCGVFEGQRYHPVYKSAHDQGTHMPGTKIIPFQRQDLNGENFIYFEVRGL